jgi:gas vesicle structural protein
MTIATQGTASNYLQRAPSPSGLVDVVDLILDKGLVIDAYVRVSLVGIEVLTIDARIVIASVDTYLRFAEAVNRLDLAAQAKDLPEMVEGTMESGARGKVRGAVEGAKESVTDAGERVKETMTDAGERAKEKVKRD